MTQPCLASPNGATKPVSTALVLVPANTVSNWEDEVKKWTGNLDKHLQTYSLRKVTRDFRETEIEKWGREGGVLFVTDQLFLNHYKSIVDCQPEILCLDEAPTMIKNSKNKVAQKLQTISSKRRLLLTGTPLQNNTTEFYELIQFVRPGAIADAKNKQEFEQVYR